MPTNSLAWQRAIILLSATLIASVLVITLYFVREVFIPLALAIYFAFLMNPGIRGLQRRGVPRVPAVLSVVLLSALALGGTGMIVVRQVTGLVGELPNYRTNITEKVRSVREMLAGSGELQEVLEEVQTEIRGNGKSSRDAGRVATSDAAAAPAAEANESDDGPRWLAWITAILAPALIYLGQMVVALVLATFILLNREDLRNRVLWLFGYGHVTSTTKAVEDGVRRISRFLLAQFFVNAGFGVALAVGLLVLNVDYALFWGFVGFLSRYLPYIGSFIAAVFPTLSSIAMAPGWSQPLMVIGLIIALEVFTANAVEPHFFGHSVGVSEVALLLAAAFWAWLWGPIGMILSAPLTIVLIVLGKHVPSLQFLDVLLGDEPVLAPDVVFYQRLIARDQDEAEELVQQRLTAPEPERVYDELLIPALSATRRGREQEDLSKADEAFVWESLRDILNDLGTRTLAATKAEAAEAAGEATNESVRHETERVRVPILGFPARDESDAIPLQMLKQLLGGERWAFEIVSSDLLSSELVERVAEETPMLIVLASLPPGGLSRTRYLCMRLRARFPNVKLIVGRWGLNNRVDENLDRLIEAGATSVATNLLDARRQIESFYPVLKREEEATRPTQFA